MADSFLSNNEKMAFTKSGDYARQTKPVNPGGFNPLFFSVGTPTGETSPPNTPFAWDFPASIFGANTQPGTVYTPILAGLIAKWKPESSILLNHILTTGGQSVWDSALVGGNTNNTAVGAYDGSNIVIDNDDGFIGKSSLNQANWSYWWIQPTNFPTFQWQRHQSISYIYNVGSSLSGTEAGLFGSYVAYNGCVNFIGAQFYKIDTYHAFFDPPSSNLILGDLVANLVPRTQGTTPLTSAGWTIANGNGWVLIPIPDFSDSIVAIVAGWPNPAGSSFPVGGTPPTPAGIFCDFSGNPHVPVGLINILTIVP